MWPAADAYAMYDLLLSIARQRRILHVLQVLNTCTAKKVCARSCHAKRLSVSNTLPARSYIASTSHSYSPSFLILIIQCHCLHLSTINANGTHRDDILINLHIQFSGTLSCTTQQALLTLCSALCSCMSQ